MTKKALIGASLLALASPATPGPKPPATNNFEPEIGYTYASGNYMDLRLANRAGDKAILVHRTAFGALGSFDLADELSKRIAYQDGGRLFVRTWQRLNGVVTISGADEIRLPVGRAERMDFSPDGGKLAFSYLSTPEFPDQGGLYVFDFQGSDDPNTMSMSGSRRP